MADKKQNIYYILAVIVIIIVIAAIAIKMKNGDEAPATEIITEPTNVLPEPVVPTDYQGNADMVKQAVCADGKIGAVITNVGPSTQTVGEGIKFLLRGMVVKNPGCDKTEVAPGESTTCTTMNGDFKVVSGKNEVVVRITGANQGLATVVCS